MGKIDTTAISVMGRIGAGGLLAGDPAHE